MECLDNIRTAHHVRQRAFRDEINQCLGDRITWLPQVRDETIRSALRLFHFVSLPPTDVASHSRYGRLGLGFNRKTGFEYSVAEISNIRITCE